VVHSFVFCGGYRTRNVAQFFLSTYSKKTPRRFFHFFKFRPRGWAMPPQKMVKFLTSFGKNSRRPNMNGGRDGMEQNTQSSRKIKCNHKFIHSGGVIWRVEGLWPPEYTHRQRQFCDNFLARPPEQIWRAWDIFSFSRCRRTQYEQTRHTDFWNSFPGLSYRPPK